MAAVGCLGVIGGSSFLKSRAFVGFERRVVETRFGKVVYHASTGPAKAVFVQVILSPGQGLLDGPGLPRDLHIFCCLVLFSV